VREAGHEISGTSVLVLGAGGAGRAVAHALGQAGARVVVSARNPDAAAVAAALSGGTTAPWPDREMACAHADVVVNATSLGMAGTPAAGEVVVGSEALQAGQVVADLVYHPRETALIVGARARGAAVVDGLGMLVHQAAIQIECWSGLTPPVPAMRAAAEQALGSPPSA